MREDGNSGGGGFSKEKPLPRTPFRRRETNEGVCEGGGFSERSPSLALPPEERRGISLTLPTDLRALASWARFPVLGLRSRRLTAPPRPCGARDEPLRPPAAGTSPFRGGFAGSTVKRLLPQRELSAVRLTEDKALLCSFLRKEARSGGKAATSYCFASFGHDQRALRSPFGNLRPSFT